MATGTSLNIVKQFSPPGNLNDFNENQKRAWSNQVCHWMDEVIIGDPANFENDGPRLQFFNPLHTYPAPDLTKKTISWVGFPRIVKIQSPSDEVRWKKADLSRDHQDEYCEWNVERDLDEKVTSVTFTCEGPEYWDFLGETDPNQVVALYQKHINSNVKKEDLFNSEGIYQPRNKWNDSGSGAMHLIQENSTLFAEIELAGGSTPVRKINGRMLTEQQELIKCGHYGESERNSDPLVGWEVNKLTREGAIVSIADPVGLYFDEFQAPGWETPDGSEATSYWKIIRGSMDTPVRAIYQVPKEREFSVGDITINGEPINYGSQIADFVHIKLTAMAQDIGKTEVNPLTGCRKRKQHFFSLNNKLPSIRSTRISG